ncbi:MAG: hypothetical protein K8T89_19820 [Planctomycetes bacterium]|nr:hypothetical protein [Planctomycetota bacterium]
MRQFWLPSLLGVLFALGEVGAAFAGWMGFRNETNDTIVIQETIIVNGMPRPGKPQRLFAGEAVRDTQCSGSVRKITITDPKNPNQILYTGNLPCPGTNENILYVVKTDAKGSVTVEAIKIAATPPGPSKR